MSAGDLPPPSRSLSREEVADYLLEIGATLATYGCPAYRLEDVVRLVADVEGFRAEPFVLPTGLWLRVMPAEAADATGPPERIPERVPEVIRMTRITESRVDLHRLAAVDSIFNDVAERRATIEEARRRIRRVASGPPAWSALQVWVAGTFASAAAAVFFRGRLIDVGVAALVGACVALVRILLRTPAQRLLSEFVGGVFAAAVGGLTARFVPGASSEVIVLAGVIALFPGMNFTTGLAEIAQKNLVSGGARLTESVMTLLLLLFGVAFVAGLQKMLGIGTPVLDPARHGLSLPYQAAALVISSMAFGVLFQVPRRYLWAAIASGATGYLATAIAVRHLPEHIAAFCAALAVCSFANALARFTQRPAQLFQLPGLVLLVPGSFGFVSLGQFLHENVTAGMQMAFTMALVGVALVVGVLVANVVMPARKLL